ncbi:Cell death protease, partial [Blyttiomyces sp. JEL0837]
LNGGPGCSSLFGSFGENGPVKFDKTGQKLLVNKYSWHTQANLLYVEQPVGTGFSFTTGSYAQNETVVANNFYTFIQNFLTVFPDLRSKKLYLTGESYAGTYIPYISQRILDGNKTPLGAKLPIKLTAIGIGNGYIDPFRQNGFGDISAGAPTFKELFNAYGFFGTNKTAIKQFNATCDLCAKYQNVTNQPNWLIDYYNLMDVGGTGNELQNVDDGLAYYLNQPAVRAALHVDTVQTAIAGHPLAWVECSDPVYYILMGNDTGVFSSYTVIPKLLDAGLPIVMWNGNTDTVCNYVSNEMIINGMTWGGKKGFSTGAWPPATPNWLVNGKAAGYKTARSGLTYLRVFNAGHMVPFNQPVAALDIVQTMFAALPLKP